MIGMSWGGFNALQIAARQPPSLSAIVSICAADDRYSDDAHYMGGAVLVENVVWGAAILAQAALPPDPELVGSSWRPMWMARLEATPRWVAQWLEHQRRDAYWRHGSVSEDYRRIRCPVYAIGGWADAYRNAVPRLLANLAVPAKGLIGPWAHGWPLFSQPGPNIGLMTELLSWWDTWLKGRPTGIMDEPRYRVWMPESIPHRPDRERQPGRWVAEPTWPSPRILARRLTLNPGRLGSESEPEAALGCSSPSHIGAAAGSWCPYASGIDLDGDQRADDGLSLVFDTGPLAATLEILGAPAVELELMADKPQAVLVARLCDVDAEGYSSRVTYGVLNLSHRDSHAAPSPLEPGRRIRVQLSLNEIAHSFPAGHRLRLALSTGYWPILWPSPERATLTVFTGASALLLPVRAVGADDAGLRPFAEPEGAEPPAMTTLAPDGRRAARNHDLSTDERTFAVDTDMGVERFDRIGIEVGGKIARRFSIAGADPLSAKASMAWTLTRRRGSWSIRIEAGIAMSADAEAFVVRQSLAAFEGESRVFERLWTDRIRRDNV
jgi:putative CocE/NonD family hydrolase